MWTTHAKAHMVPLPCARQVMVVMKEETQSFSSFVTKICAVIGGIYTVVGLLDSVLYHTAENLKKMA